MIYYCVEIAQEMPEQRTDHNVPLWEALVAVPDEVEIRSKRHNQSRDLHPDREWPPGLADRQRVIRTMF